MSASQYDTRYDAPIVDGLAPPLHVVTDALPIDALLPYHGWRRHVKRVMDVALSVLALVAFLPVLVAIGVAIRISSPGPALYRQDRVGQDGVTFRIFKFRTMYVDSDERLNTDETMYERYVANDYKLGTHEDPRVTRVGRFLRRTSLDELPQLLNIIAGSMTLVGPRPIVRSELQLYGSAVTTYLQLRPGLTGKWQVEGRNIVRYPERAWLDDEYLRTWSLMNDFIIMLKTVPSVLRRRGCH